MSSIAATRSRELLTLDAAAELLGVSTSTVRRRITDGQRRAFRTGKRLIRIRIQDLDDLLREIPCAGRRPRSVTMSQAEQVDGRWPVVVDAEAAYEAIRSINHRAIWLSDGLPAPAATGCWPNLSPPSGPAPSRRLSSSVAGSPSRSATTRSTRTMGAIRRRRSRLPVRRCRLPRTLLDKLAHFLRPPSWRSPARDIGPCPSKLVRHETAAGERWRAGVAS